eukprot:UN26444
MACCSTSDTYSLKYWFCICVVSFKWSINERIWFCMFCGGRLGLFSNFTCYVYCFCITRNHGRSGR